MTFPAGFWPGYTYPGQPAKTIPAPAVRCECGAESAGCGPGAHSDWCPKSAGRPRP